MKKHYCRKCIWLWCGSAFLSSKPCFNHWFCTDAKDFVRILNIRELDLGLLAQIINCDLLDIGLVTLIRYRPGIGPSSIAIACVANAGFMIHDGVGSYMWFCITPYLYGVTDARLVVMGKRELVSSAETSRVQGKRYDWSPECGRGRWGRLVSRSVSCAGDVPENGRVLGNENVECDSPAWIDLTTPWWNARVILEDRTWTWYKYML